MQNRESGYEAARIGDGGQERKFIIAR